MIQKAFKFRIYPDREQCDKLTAQFGCMRFVYNHYRRVREAYYQETGTGLTYFDCATDLTERLKVDYPWLKDADSQAMQQVLKDLDRAYGNFLAGRADYPTFKRKHGNQSYRYPQRFKLDGGRVYLPKVGWVKVVQHRRIAGKMKNCTGGPLGAKTKTGKYFVSIQCEVEHATPERKPDSVGVDLGLSSFAILSTGEKINSPMYLRKAERLLRIRQRRLSRKVKGSHSRGQARYAVAAIHERVANQRRDFHHKLSRQIVDGFSTIGLETLHVKGMVKNHKLAKSISDAGWAQFVQFVTYKAAWVGSEIIKHDRWFASSKTCSACGAVNQSLNLRDRTWVCRACGSIHDRDVNAALNLEPTTVGATESYAGGDMSRVVEHSAPEKFQVIYLAAQVL